MPDRSCDRRQPADRRVRLLLSRRAGATPWRSVLGEVLGSGLLTVVVVGSGIAAQRLSPGDAGLQLLENAAATAVGLYALILVFAPVSGAHFNPVVTLVDVALGARPWRTALCYVPAQVVGCALGAVTADVMFAEPALEVSTHHRASGAHLLSEAIATAGLVLVVFALARSGRGASAPSAVGAYIGGAYFFTSSTSFANPAITVGRTLSDTFAGIAPASAPAFVVAQAVGGVAGYAAVRALYPGPAPTGAADVAAPADVPAPRPRRERDR